jgi:hypothetical protein
MRKVMNTIVGRFYGFLTNYIYVRRSGIRPPVTVSLLDPKKRDVSTSYLLSKRQTPDSLTMPGYLHDISRAELSLIVPSLHFGNHDLIDCSTYTLQISVEFSNRTINIQAAPVRYDTLDEPQSQCKYIIGARITQMADSERNRLVQYIQQVTRSKSEASKTSFAHDAESF